MSSKRLEDFGSAQESATWLVEAWWEAYKSESNTRLARECEKLCKTFDTLIELYGRSQYLFRQIEALAIFGKRPKYYRTGVIPKWSNRTRKKQRLTRLQRRWRRQRR